MKETIIRIICPTIIFLFATTGFGQKSIDEVLEEVEKNNKELAALRSNLEANNYQSKTGLWLSNPEVEFKYLWANKPTLDSRFDYSISQTFDFPTAYKHRRQISKLKIEQAHLEYKQSRLEILSLAVNISADLNFNNAVLVELKNRIENAKGIADSFKRKMDAGETTIIDFNKAQVFVLNLTKKYESIELQISILQQELELLNGGNKIDFIYDDYSLEDLEPDFEKWFEQAKDKNPVILWLAQELEISKNQIKLQASQNLPKFRLGYMSENLGSESFNGLTIGLTIPLWENKNTKNYLKARASSTEQLKENQALSFLFEMKNLHIKAIFFKNSYLDFRQKLSQLSNFELINKALASGELSLSQYYTELTFFYESTDKLLELKKSAKEALNQLNRFFL